MPWASSTISQAASRCGRSNIRQRRTVAIHAEHPFRDHQLLTIGWRCQQPRRGAGCRYAESGEAAPAQRGGFEQRSVAETIGDDPVFAPGKCGDRRLIGGKPEINSSARS
jgi:hypothetical protein